MPTSSSPTGMILKLIFFGQFICITFSGSGVFSQLLDTQSLSTPYSNSIIVYAILFSFLLFNFSSERIKTKKYKFLICAIFDFLGLIFVLFAYESTKLASIDLMSVFGITSAAILSMIFLQLRYTKLHYLGIVISLGGIIMTLWSDIFDQNMHLNLGGFQGDLFAILSSISYAVSNVIQEKLLKQGSNLYAYLGNVGMFNLVLSAIGFLAFRQFFVFDQYVNLKEDSSRIVVVYYIGYGVFAVVNYVLIGIFVQKYGATAYNLISLCTVLWSMMCDVFIFGKQFKWLNLGGFGLIIIGVVIFHIKKPRKLQNKQRPSLSSYTQSRISDQEKQGQQKRYMLSEEDSDQNNQCQACQKIAVSAQFM